MHKKGSKTKRKVPMYGSNKDMNFIEKAAKHNKKKR